MTTIYDHEAKGILSLLSKGTLTRGPFPFTHTVSAYTGCALGSTTCGLFCYAPMLGNWTYRPAAIQNAAWGEAVLVKENAPELLAAYLSTARPSHRQGLRILLSSVSDPYQPIEAERCLTRRLLEVFAAYDDLDVLVIPTRSPLVARDLDLIRRIPYAWLSLTIETDDDDAFTLREGGPLPSTRLALASHAVAQGVKVQITVSPCLPHSAGFAARLAETGVQRFVVDTFTAGDGARGARTASTLWPAEDPTWRSEDPARLLYAQLDEAGMTVGWGAAGFCGIPFRSGVADARGAMMTRASQRATERARDAHDLPDAAPEDLTLTLGRRGEPMRTMRGFTYLWLKYVSGFNPAVHCAGGLLGTYHEFGSPVVLPARHILDATRAPVFYLCGVSESQWADNLHIPFVYAPGEEVVAATYHSVAIHIANARRLDIPWIEDGWNDFPRSYTTCRNWQFGVAHFGYDGHTRPAQGEFTTPQRLRTAEHLVQRQHRRLSRLSKRTKTS